MSIYTPGSSAGLPLRVLRSFDAPPAALIDDTDAFRERVASTVSGLLALLGIDADPNRSREHILLSNILHRAWGQGKSLDLGALIREIQSPPFDRIGVMDLDLEPETGARFSELPAEAARAKSYPRWGKKLADHLYRNRGVTLLKCSAPKASSTVGESEGEFRARLTQLVREKRDLKVAKLQKRYTPKLARLNERIRKAEAKVGREQSQYGQQKMQTAISMGATVLGALFGRKVASVGTVGRASTTMRGVGRAARERGDIALGRVALVWTPWRVGKDGIAEPVFR